MANQSKRWKEARQKVDSLRRYSLEEAVQLLDTMIGAQSDAADFLRQSLGRCL